MNQKQNMLAQDLNNKEKKYVKKRTKTLGLISAVIGLLISLIITYSSNLAFLFQNKSLESSALENTTLLITLIPWLCSIIAIYAVIINEKYPEKSKKYMFFAANGFLASTLAIMICLLTIKSGAYLITFLLFIPAGILLYASKQEDVIDPN